jgi:hypothetical protein
MAPSRGPVTWKKVTFFSGSKAMMIVAGDGGFAHDVRLAFLHHLATRAEVGREEQPGVAGLQNQAFPCLRAG